jgi:hypothetical protein
VAEFAEEVGFFHVVFEGFTAVDEDYRDFVGELATELFVAIDVDVLPGEAAAAMQFGQALLNDLAEMATFAGVDHDLAKFGHCAEFNKGGGVILERTSGGGDLRCRNAASCVSTV